jgi:hypothetical protein
MEACRLGSSTPGEIDGLALSTPGPCAKWLLPPGRNWSFARLIAARGQRSILTNLWLVRLVFPFESGRFHQRSLKLTPAWRIGDRDFTFCGGR